MVLKSSQVWILIYGTGEDGNECKIDSVYGTYEQAFNAWKRETGKTEYPKEEASFYTNWSIEEWDVEC